MTAVLGRQNQRSISAYKLRNSSKTQLDESFFFLEKKEKNYFTQAGVVFARPNGFRAEGAQGSSTGVYRHYDA